MKYRRALCACINYELKIAWVLALVLSGARLAMHVVQADDLPKCLDDAKDAIEWITMSNVEMPLGIGSSHSSSQLRHKQVGAVAQ
eukprot:5453701-Amphidinium_carterae.2